MSFLQVLVVSLFYTLVAGSHFRGGIVQFRPLNPTSTTDLRIEITHRIAWRRSAGFYCDQSAINAGTLFGGGSLQCISGCSGSVAGLQFQCTDFSLTEDWAAGERTQTYSNPSSVIVFEARYYSCCWIRLNSGGGYWELRVRFNLNRRADTGRINTSPVSNTPPIVRVQRNCQNRISIPVQDVDGDDVRCRWASSSQNECAGVCQTFTPASTLTDCTITYAANSLSSGWYGVALQIEDFASTSSNVPLSSIPLQFLVEIFDSSQSCASRPTLVVPPTIPDGQCIGVPFGTTWTSTIVAMSGSPSVRITGITTASPPGLTKSALTSLGSQRYSVTVTWTATTAQSGPQIFCYSAVDSIGVSSTQFCITLLGGGQGPQPVASSVSPSTYTLSNQATWTMQFDREFVQPTSSVYIRVYEQGGTEVLSIDASSSAVTYPSNSAGRDLTFRTSYNFVIGRRYYVLLDAGVARGTDFCGLVSPAVTDTTFWTVTVAECASGTRLVGSNSGYNFEGRVEVCVNGFWGSVCDDGWTNVDASVVCRQLSISTTGILAYGSAQYGQASGPIHLDDVACTGTESSLLSCTYDSNTADCTHAEDAGVRCHTLPTTIIYGTRLTGSAGSGEYVYYRINSWALNNRGVTISLAVRSGSVICYASDRYQSPSQTGGYDWRVQTNEYAEVFIDPATLGRTAGSILYVAILCQQSTNTFTIQASIGNTRTTGVLIGNVISGTLTSGQSIYYSLPYSSQGISIKLNVTSGSVICYASGDALNPSATDYDWRVQVSGYDEVFLDSSVLTVPVGPRVFITLFGVSTTNTYSFTSTVGDTTAVRATIGAPLTGSVPSGRIVYYVIPFHRDGVTIRIEVSRGYIRCYGSDLIRRPSGSSYIWRLDITGYQDSFLDPSTLGRPAGDFIYIGLEGVHTINDFTLNTTQGDTHIENSTIGVGITDVLGSGGIKYYVVPFPVGGITIRLDVSSGTVICYASATVRNPGPNNYAWILQTSGYADSFIGPSDTTGPFIYIALVGVSTTNNFVLNSTSGDKSTLELSFGLPVTTTVSRGQLKYYIFPFSPSGVTIRVAVSAGGYVRCYASDRQRNPSSLDYIWRIDITEYEDSFIDPSTLGRPAGQFLYVSLEGINIANNFTINSTTGDTSIADVTFNTGTTVTLSSGQVKYYSVPFPIGGVTLRLDVSVGYVRCYASDVVRNPNSDDYVWFIETRGFADDFIVPSTASRPVGAYVYIALVGVDPSSTFILNSTTGDTSTLDVQISNPVNQTVSGSELKYYIFPFLTTGVTIRVEVAPGSYVRCYASDRQRNPSSLDYIWRIDITEYEDSFIDPSTLGRPAGQFLYVSLEGVNPANTFTLNSTTGDTSIADVTFNTGTTVTLLSGQVKYYSVPFPIGGVTLRLDVSVGYVRCYASDVVRNPNSDDYVWFIETRGFADDFIVPSTASRPVGAYVYIALVGVDPSSTFILNSTTGDTSTLDVQIGSPVTEIVRPGQLRYYIFPFLTTGVTIRVEVATGGYVRCYASDRQRNPSSLDYIWTINITGYEDTYINPSTLGRIAGEFLYVSIEGVNTLNNFTLNSTSGDTSILDVPIGQTVTDTVRGGYFEYYAYPFPTNGITIKLTVPTGYITCYVSDRYRNPSETEYDWVFDIDYYGETLLYPRDLNREPGSLLYIALRGIEVSNSFQLNTTFGDTLTLIPIPPLNVQSSNVLPTTATISWQPPPPNVISPWSIITGYQLILVEDEFNLPAIQENTTDTFFTFVGLEEYDTYHVRIAAENGVGLGNYSIEITFNTPQAAPTAPPVAQSSVPVSPTLITISWLDPPAIHINGIIDHYVIDVTEVYTGRQFSLIARQLRANIGPLHPYYVYECRIAVYTVDIGPFSPPFIAQAGETVPTASPQNVTTASSTPDSITLTWDPPPFEHQNGLIRQYTINVLHPVPVAGQYYSNTTQITVEGLQPFTNYTFNVAAETIGIGPFTTNITLSTAEDAPQVSPDSVTVFTPNATSISLAWNPVPSSQLNGILRGYTITLVELNTGIVSQHSTTADELSIVVYPVHPAYTYNCSVSAVTVTPGPHSEPIVIVTPPAAPSAPPQNFVVTQLSSQSAYIVWDPPPLPDQNGDILMYAINVTVRDTGETFQLISQDVSLNISSLNPFFTYVCIVAAVTIAGQGPFSNPFVIITPEDIPSKPLGVSVVTSVGAPNEIEVSWREPVMPNGVLLSYSVYCYEGSESVGSGSGILAALAANSNETVYTAVVPPNTTSTIVTGLAPFTRYNCYVTGSTIAGEGPPSTVQFGVTDESVPVDPPVDFEVSVVNSTAVLVTWSPPPTPNGRIVSYTLTYNLSGESVSVNTADNVQYLVAGLNEYTVYEFYIYASTRIGDGPTSQSVSVRTAIGAPSSEPLNVQVTITGTRSAEFSWESPEFIHQNGPITHYVLRIEDLDLNSSAIVITTTNTTHTLSILEEYILYSFQVAAATDGGVGPFSTPIQFRTLQDVPSASPQMVTGSVESDSLIQLAWLPPPPADQNGVIRYYLIAVTELETGRSWTLPVLHEISAFIGSLHPNYNYECRVAAVTIGRGPFSETITLQTNEAAPVGSPMALVPTTVTSETLTLAWLPPPLEEINGVIRNYIIRVTEIDTGYTFSQTSNTTEVTLYDLHPFYSYSCAVASVTVGAGPFSPAITVQLQEDVPTGAPESLSGTAADSTTINIQWSPPPIESQNGIIRSYLIVITEVETSAVFNHTTANSNFQAQNLHPNYNYEISVSAITISPGPFSDSITIQTPEDVPSVAPGQPTLGDVTSTSFNLSWRAIQEEYHNGEILGYNITINAVGTNEMVTLFSVTTFTVVASLRPYTMYTCSVAAYTSAGTGPYSTVATITTSEAAPSREPGDVNVAVISSTSIMIMWSPPPLLSQNGLVREYRINITEEETARILYFTSTTTTLTLTALHPYYTYHCTVSAYTVESGPYSSVVTVRTAEDFPTGYPQNLSVSSASSRDVTLTWDPPLSSEQNGLITGYLVNLTSVATGETIELSSATPNLLITSLSPFSTYSCIITALNSVGSGPYSTAISFSTLEEPPSAAPLSLTGAVLSSQTLSLSWQPPPPTDHNGLIREYHINVTEVDTGREFQLISSTNSLTLSSLHPYYTYEWAVAAVTIREGPFTLANRLTTLEDVPSGAPQNFSGIAETTTISLSWQPPFPGDRNGIILGYTIELRPITNQIALDDIISRSVTANNLTVEELMPFTTYQCVVSAYTRVGSGPQSNVITVQTDETNPSGNPTNTSAVALNSSHIYLTWDPPPDHQLNGEIRHYRINITEVESSQQFQVTSQSDVTELIVGPLHPFYTYRCTITAVTVGEGPPSTVITVRTEEEAPSGPPRNFAVNQIQAMSVFLTWDMPLPELLNGILRQYIVTIEIVQTGEVRSIQTSANILTVQALSPFTNYVFSVSAETVAIGPPSELITAMTLQDAPNRPPQLVDAQSLTSTSLVLSWQPPPEENSNGIILQYRLNITELETGVVMQETSMNTTLYVNSLHPYYTYSYIVAAETIAGLGPYSAPVIVQLPEDAPSSSPVNLVASRVTSTSFFLTWSSPPPADHNGLIRHYTVSCREDLTGATFQAVSPVTEQLIESIHPNFAYTCMVAAVTVSLGPFSTEVTIITLEDVPAAAPENFTVISESSTSLTLSWSTPSLLSQNGVITGYVVNVTRMDTGETVTVTTQERRITVDSLRPYRRYQCVVAAQTSVGYGPYSEPLVAGTLPDVPSAAPSQPLTQTITSTSVVLSWTPPTSEQLNGEISHYLILGYETETGRNFNLTTVQTQFTVGDLHPFYTYRFSVCPVTIDTGPCANFSSILTPQDAPTGFPESFSSTVLGSTSLLLSWQPPPIDVRNGIIVEYLINVSVVETDERFQLSSTNTSLTIDSLHPFYVYNFFVSAATVVGNGPYTQSLSIQLPEDVPSAAPESPSAEVLNSTSVLVIWRPPISDGQNGVITSYTVKLVEISSNATFTYRREGVHTEILIDNLHPYYDYLCSVAAETSVGQGPFSPAFTFQTEQDAPSAPPTSIEGSATSPTAVQLTWSPPPADSQNGIIEYYLINVTETDSSRQFQLRANDTSVTANGLHPYYTYSFRISTVTISQGSYSTAISIRTLPDVPTATPQSFTAVPVSSTSIRITWSPPPPTDQNGVIRFYYINVTEFETGETTQHSVDGTDTLLVVNSLHPYYTYHCSIAAYTVEIGPAALTQVQTFEEEPTGTPQNVSVTVMNATSVRVQWLPPVAEQQNGRISGYIIRVLSGASRDIVQELLASATDTMLVVNGLHPFSMYTFTLAAQTTGSGPFSAWVSVHMPEAVPGGGVTNLSVEITSPSSVAISWLPPSVNVWNGIITRYTAEYQRIRPVNSQFTDGQRNASSIPRPGVPLANSQNPTLATTPLQVETLHIAGLEEYYIYQFSVYFENSAGVSESSQPLVVEMPSSAPSGAPTDVVVNVLSSTSIGISWQEPTQLEQNGIIVGYMVVLVPIDSRASEQNKTFTTTAETKLLHVEDLEKFTTFNAMVAAGTADGYGPFSEPVVAKTLEDVPGTPTNLEAKVTDTAIELTWFSPRELNGIILDYQVNYFGYKAEQTKTKRATNKIPQDGPYTMNVTLSDSQNQTKVTIKQYRPGLTYDLMVRARTVIGYGPNSTVTVDTMEPVVDEGGVNTDNSGATVPVAVVFAVLGWVAFMIVVIIVIALVIWYRRKREKKLTIAATNLTAHGGFVKTSQPEGEVVLQSYGASPTDDVLYSNINAEMDEKKDLSTEMDGDLNENDCESITRI